jgi:predicted AlkP superfamily pyrophosphatase or phosphodiesterase
VLFAGAPARSAISEGIGDTPPSAVVMISLDGVRPSEVTPELLPSLVELAGRGTRAERLIPEFPSNTFPNHVSLVTGVAPERHGIVDNTFIDPSRGRFEKRDIPNWIEVQPLWSLLAERGIVSASFYWVGSEGGWGERGGPRYWRPFESDTPEREKVEQILAWLDLPFADRPRFVTSWFHGADHAGHVHGPGSPQVAEQLRAQNAAVESLVAGVRARGLWQTTTLLFVSDHGMASASHRVDLGSALRAAGVSATVIGIGGAASVYLEASDLARGVEVARRLGLSAWPRADAPPRLRVRNPRFGDIVVVAPIGTAIIRQGLTLKGFHGYLPEVPEMSAMLVAAGRRVPAGATLPAIRNVDVAPTVLSLLGVPVPDWMEGTPIAAFEPRISRPASGAEPKKRRSK